MRVLIIIAFVIFLSDSTKQDTINAKQIEIVDSLNIKLDSLLHILELKKNK